MRKRFWGIVLALALFAGMLPVLAPLEAAAVSGIDSLTCSGSTTILDGIYPFYTTNHTGPYAALQLDMSATNGYGYYTPGSDPDGFKNGASGINVHTRVTGISWYPWINYYSSPKELNTFSPSHFQIKAKYNASSVNSLPCAADTSGSIKPETTAAGDLYTCTGVYYNHAGNYWYEVIAKAGSGIRSCCTCGLVSSITTAATGHSYGSWTTVEASCTEDVSKSRSRSTCGYVDSQVLDKSGHSYSLTVRAATCLVREGYLYSCAICDDSYEPDLKPYQSQGSETIPDGLDISLFATRTQYHYCDRGTDGWGSWSEWSDSAVDASLTRQVETRATPLGDHSWNEGICSVCGKECVHSYSGGVCSICAYVEPDNDLYLFGFINGSNYAREEDAANRGVY